MGERILTIFFFFFDYFFFNVKIVFEGNTLQHKQCIIDVFFLKRFFSKIFLPQKNFALGHLSKQQEDQQRRSPMEVISTRNLGKAKKIELIEKR